MLLSNFSLIFQLIFRLTSAIISWKVLKNYAKHFFQYKPTLVSSQYATQRKNKGKRRVKLPIYKSLTSYISFRTFFHGAWNIDVFPKRKKLIKLHFCCIQQTFLKPKFLKWIIECQFKMRPVHAKRIIRGAYSKLFRPKQSTRGR